MTHQLFLSALAVWLCVALAPSARAATVDLIALSPTAGLQAGDIVTLEISFQMPVPVFSGGLELMFDETQLELVGITDNMLGDPGLGASPEYVAGSGLISRWSIFSFAAFATGTFGSVEFRVRDGATSTSVALGPAQGLPWLDANDLGDTIIEPAYGSIALTAVPLPASLWLLGGALAVLGRLQKPRLATNAV